MTIKHVAAFGLALCMSGPALASNPACTRKISEIESQISHAKEAGNLRRVSGLERALSATRDKCTDAGLISDKEEDIADKQEDIAEIREEIREKEAEGRLDKVQKLERKLAHERGELGILMQELAEIKGAAASSSK
jgi:DNA repair exonuclease SbcCD ATPase subunit